jgi:hypothetical protein
MPTVIDSLVLELGLDPAKFSAQQREAVSSLRSMEQEQLAAGRRIESETKRVGNILTDFRRNALQITSLFLGGMGIQQFTSYVTNLDANAGRLGRTMNMTARDVTIWQGAIKQVGGSAEEANTSLSAMSEDMNRFQLTGQSSMLPVLSRLGVSLYDQNRNLKTSGQLWLEISDAIAGMDSAQATSFLRMLPGATQGMINLALLGPGRLREYLEVQRQLGAATAQSAEEAEKYQRALANVESSATNLGRTLLSFVAPAAIAVMNALQKGIRSLSDSPEDRQRTLAEMDKDAGGTTTQVARRKFGDVPQWMKDALNRGMLAKWLGKDFFEDDGAVTPMPPESTGPAAGAGVSRSVVPPSASEMERRIRAKFSARGINPGRRGRVAKSEGLFAYQYSSSGQSFVPGEQSFGPFQLNYGRDGRASATSSRATGPRRARPLDVAGRCDFSLERRRAAAGDRGTGGRETGSRESPRRPRRRRGGSTVNIGTLQVNAPQAKDAAGIARELGPALERSVTAGAANQGPN